jgi:hypothetical protein
MKIKWLQKLCVDTYALHSEIVALTFRCLELSALCPVSVFDEDFELELLFVHLNTEFVCS